GIGQKGYELADVEDVEKSIKRRMRRKRRSCLWLCFSNVELGSAVQEDEQEEKGERSAVNGLPVVSAFSHVDEEEKLVLGNKSCLIMCFSNLEVYTKG
ncbi:uncharacterized protein J3R85_002063, partial [Psidium guajava]